MGPSFRDAQTAEPASLDGFFVGIHREPDYRPAVSHVKAAAIAT